METREPTARTSMDLTPTPSAPPGSGTALRPFKCPACSSRFTRLENLNRHTRSVHRESNRRPFPCLHCNVSFSRSDLRKRHIKKCHPAAAPSESPKNPEPQLSINTADAPELGADLFPSQDISWLFRLPRYIAAYFEKFHPTLPLLHQPTFAIGLIKEPLLQAVACIGAVCYSPGSDQSISVALFDTGCKFLDQYTREDRSRFREVWVFQAYILFEYFAFYSCNDDLFPKALSIHRLLIDAAREYQMLQDRAALNGGDAEASQEHGDDCRSDSLSLHQPDSGEDRWRRFIKEESEKRNMYSLYYLDSQLSISCNMRPLLSALELKCELPCRDDLWSAQTACVWNTILQSHSSSFNEEDDNDGNPDPRPAQGDLYESLMHLIQPDRATRQPLGLLWYSPFASLMLIIQIQMVVRELTVASSFLYSNLRPNETRHNLSIITEESRDPLYQALNNLADLIPKADYLSDAGIGLGDGLQSSTTNQPLKILWHSVWIAWHYAAISLTHQDALLTTGMVEYSLPAALSTAWELGKPRAKQHRDVYADRDVTRIVNDLEQIMELMNVPPTCPMTSDGVSMQQCLEDPFIAMLGFKACMMGWRVVRLMSLGVEQTIRVGALPVKPSVYAVAAQILLARLMTAAGSQDPFTELTEDQLLSEHNLATPDSYEDRYLDWASRAFSLRNTWPNGTWMLAMFKETRREAR